MKLRALSVEAQQQAEELAVWRLTSQPAPVFDLPNTDDKSETQDQISTVKQPPSNQQQPDEMTQGLNLTVQAQVEAPNPVVQESPGNVTVIREDEFVLSCSFNKPRGHMLFSR